MSGEGGAGYLFRDLVWFGVVYARRFGLSRLDLDLDADADTQEGQDTEDTGRLDRGYHQDVERASASAFSSSGASSSSPSGIPGTHGQRGGNRKEGRTAVAEHADGGGGTVVERCSSSSGGGLEAGEAGVRASYSRP